MKQQIKKSLRKLVDWMIIWIGIIIIVSLFWFVWVWAGVISWWWSTSGDTGIIIDSNPINLYTTANNQLTSAKWNALVQRTKREDVTWTANFDIDCQRRATRDDWIIIYPTYTSLTQFFSSYSGTQFWYILSSNKTVFNAYPTSTSSIVSKMQKMCNK